MCLSLGEMESSTDALVVLLSRDSEYAVLYVSFEPEKIAENYFKKSLPYSYSLLNYFFEKLIKQSI